MGKKCPKPDGQLPAGRLVINKDKIYTLTGLDGFHVAPHLALLALRGAELHKILDPQAERELVLELVALVEEEHNRDVLQQLRLAQRL